MAKAAWNRTIVDASGNVLPGADITVTDERTGTLATLFDDRDGNVAKSNPFTADTNGFARFFADAGVYRVVAEAGALSRTWRYQSLLDNGVPITWTEDQIFTGNATVEGDFDIEGNATVEGNFDIEGALDVDGAIDVDGNASIGGDLSVGGEFSIVDLDVTGQATFTQPVTVGEAINPNDAVRLSQVEVRITGNTTVRQTVLTGPVDSDGRADFIEAGTGLEAVTTNLTSNPLQITFGDGFELGEQRNLGVKIDSDLSWSGLPDDEDEVFLFIRVTEAGTVSTFHSLFAPEYAQSAPESPADGQTFYPIDHRHRMQERVGGGWVSDDLIICVGECATDGGSVVDVVSYVFQGSIIIDVDSSVDWGSPRNSSIYAHNIGTDKIYSCVYTRITSSSGNLIPGSFVLCTQSSRFTGDGNQGACSIMKGKNKNLFIWTLADGIWNGTGSATPVLFSGNTDAMRYVTWRSF